MGVGASEGAGPNDPILELLRQNQATLEEIAAKTLKSTRQQQLMYPAQHPSKRLGHASTAVGNKATKQKNAEADPQHDMVV